MTSVGIFIDPVASEGGGLRVADDELDVGVGEGFEDFKVTIVKLH